MTHKFEIKSNSQKPATGKILISEPLLQDAYFRRSVVLLIEHSEQEGTVGVILNKPLDVTFNKVVKNSPVLEAGMYLGGPVETGNVYFLHTLGDRIENSIEINKGLFWGGNIEQVNELIRLNIILPESIRFFIGYSGWEPKQLDNELKLNSWAIVKATSKEIWKQTPSGLWLAMVNKLGNNYDFWKKMPEDPLMN